MALAIEHVYGYSGDDRMPAGQLLDGIARRPAWMADAACREHPEVEFHPTAGQPTAPAKAVCGGCLTRSECLAYAQAEGIDHGVWGGLSAQERRTLASSTPDVPRGQRPRQVRARSAGQAKAARQAKVDALAAQAAGWRRNVENARATRAKRSG